MYCGITFLLCIGSMYWIHTIVYSILTLSNSYEFNKYQYIPQIENPNTSSLQYLPLLPSCVRGSKIRVLSVLHRNSIHAIAYQIHVIAYQHIHTTIHTRYIPTRDLCSTRILPRIHVLACILLCIGMYCASIAPASVLLNRKIGAGPAGSVLNRNSR